MDEPAAAPAPPGPGAPQTDAQFLAAYLAGHDVPCPACGYNLRGVSRGACPECGLTITLRIAESAPHRAYWYAALAGLLWPLLLNGMLTAVWLLFDLMSSSRQFRFAALRDQRYTMVVSATMLVLCLAGLVFLIRTRNRPWRPRTRRIVLGALITIFAIHAAWLLGFQLLRPLYP